MSDVLGLASGLVQIALPFVAESIRLAHKLAPARWGTTPYNPGIRLNVGFCELLTVTPDFIRVLAHRDSIDRGALTGAQLHGLRPPGFYPSTPGSVLVVVPTTPLSLTRRLLTPLRAAHNDLIRVAATRGFNRGSQAGHKDWAVDEVAEAIDEQLPHPEHSGRQRPIIDLEASALEGDERWVTHLQRERNQSLVEKKKKQALRATSGLSCEACGFDFRAIYGDFAADLCEVHHRKPLSSRKAPAHTSLRDLAILCPNCHRAIHRTDPMISVEELGKLVAARSSRP